MRDASKLTLMLGLVAVALAGCTSQAEENNVAIDINNAAPGDIEQLPPDESVDTTSNELANGADDPEANAATNAPANGH